MRLDADRFAAVVASTIKSALSGIVERVTALEQRQVVHGKDGAPGPAGKDADLSEIVELKAELAALRFDMSARETEPEPVDVQALVDAAVAKTVSALPPAQHGKDGAPGASVDLADVEAMVAKAVDAIPRPQDGRSVTVEDIEPLVSAAVTKAVDALPVPKDGAGILSAVIDRDGHLLLTISDGSTKDLGVIVGNDAKVEDVARFVAEEVAKIPLPKDGAPGRDGTLENIKCVRLDERTIQFQFKDGTPVEGGTIRLNHPVYKDVFVAGKKYGEADLVQRDGSGWIALVEEPAGVPGTGKPEDTGWKLFIKKGGDGKPGPVGKEGQIGKTGPQGPQGRNGY